MERSQSSVLGILRSNVVVERSFGVCVCGVEETLTREEKETEYRTNTVTNIRYPIILCGLKRAFGVRYGCNVKRSLNGSFNNREYKVREGRGAVCG